jgi:hypothetical protein
MMQDITKQQVITLSISAMRGQGDMMTVKGYIEINKKWWIVLIRSDHGAA